MVTHVILFRTYNEVEGRVDQIDIFTTFPTPRMDLSENMLRKITSDIGVCNLVSIQNGLSGHGFSGKRNPAVAMGVLSQKVAKILIQEAELDKGTMVTLKWGKTVEDAKDLGELCVY